MVLPTLCLICKTSCHCPIQVSKNRNFRLFVFHIIIILQAADSRVSDTATAVQCSMFNVKHRRANIFYYLLSVLSGDFQIINILRSRLADSSSCFIICQVSRAEPVELPSWFRYLILYLPFSLFPLRFSSRPKFCGGKWMASHDDLTASQVLELNLTERCTSSNLFCSSLGAITEHCSRSFSLLLSPFLLADVISLWRKNASGIGALIWYPRHSAIKGKSVMILTKGSGIAVIFHSRTNTRSSSRPPRLCAMNSIVKPSRENFWMPDCVKNGVKPCETIRSCRSILWGLFPFNSWTAKSMSMVRSAYDIPKNSW